MTPTNVYPTPSIDVVSARGLAVSLGALVDEAMTAYVAHPSEGRWLAADRVLRATEAAVRGWGAAAGGAR